MISNEFTLLAQARKLSLINYRVNASVGVYESEGAPQPLTITVDVYERTSSSMDDAMSCAYDYTQLKDAADEVIAEGHIALQETLVARIAQKLLSDSRLLAVRIKSMKTGAVENADGVAVEILKFRHE